MSGVRNASAPGKSLRPIGGPRPLLAVGKLFPNGHIFEDIELQTRAHDMFRICNATAGR